ncbi:MAG: peptide chain release factor N(5)-glutamine methyltransferase [Arcanobacterium sp.]|nr:peptide chain release factor N(5)-glutamine methyltransferase [Arcanobacterium sp.]
MWDEKSMLAAGFEPRVRHAAHVLEQAGVASSLHDARELAKFAQHSGEDFDTSIARRAAREPLQHILGVMYFRYLELESRPGVFIVRPETEMVAQAGIDAIAGIARPRVLDLCTGSGAIALAIATEVSSACVWAIEKSAQAFASAQRNNAKYGNVVTFLHGDALDAETLLKQEIAEAGRFDMVISNPPYVPLYHELSPEVRQDPEMALFGGGEAGLEFPLAVVERAARLLRGGGVLIMEHASEQAAPLCAAATAAGFVQVSTGTDLTGAPRFLRAQWPGRAS